jgi:hypothetical protein
MSVVLDSLRIRDEQDIDRRSAERTLAFRKGVLRRMQGCADHQGNSVVVPRIADTARPLFGRTPPETKRGTYDG